MNILEVVAIYMTLVITIFFWEVYDASYKVGFILFYFNFVILILLYVYLLYLSMLLFCGP